jgi:antitoxin Phd
MNNRKMPSWQLHEAKNRFSDLFDDARERGPQRVTRHGKRAVIVVAEEEWQRVTKRIPSLAALLAECPLKTEDLLPRQAPRIYRNPRAD